MPNKEPCRCKCGYTCGRQCGLDISECIEKHYRKDCDHNFDGPVVKDPDGLGDSVTCSKCGMNYGDHAMRCGP